MVKFISHRHCMQLADVLFASQQSQQVFLLTAGGKRAKRIFKTRPAYGQLTLLAVFGWMVPIPAVARGKMTPKQYATHVQELYSTPALKFAFRLLLYCFFVALYVSELIRHAQQFDHDWGDGDAFYTRWGRTVDAGEYQVMDASAQEIVLFVWMLGLAVDKIHQKWSCYGQRYGMITSAHRKAVTSKIFKSGALVWVALATVVMGRVVSAQMEAGRTIAVGQYVYAACFGLAAFHVFGTLLLEYLIVLNKKLGLLVVIVSLMLYDLYTFSTFFIIFMAAFSCYFFILGVTSARGPWHAAPIAIWAVFDKEAQFAGMTGRTSEDYPMLVGLWFIGLLGSVGMFNLLIAMFSDSYARAQEGTERIFNSAKQRRVELYRLHVHPLPPPFNLPLLLWQLLRACSSFASQDVGLDSMLAFSNQLYTATSEALSFARADKVVDQLSRVRQFRELDMRLLVEDDFKELERRSLLSKLMHESVVKQQRAEMRSRLDVSILSVLDELALVKKSVAELKLDELAAIKKSLSELRDHSDRASPNQSRMVTTHNSRSSSRRASRFSVGRPRFDDYGLPEGRGRSASRSASADNPARHSALSARPERASDAVAEGDTEAEAAQGERASDAIAEGGREAVAAQGSSERDSVALRI